MSVAPPDIVANVPRETLTKLSNYVALLLKWQKSINLIANNADDIWSRHIDDSLQLAAHLPESTRDLIDLGSGGGLPGIVLAIARPNIAINLVERDIRKATFLRECVRVLSLSNAQVLNQDIEKINQQADIVTARALAALPQLLAYSENFCREGGVSLFPKGRNYAIELAAAEKDWRFKLELLESRTSAESKLLKISQLRRINV